MACELVYATHHRKSFIVYSSWSVIIDILILTKAPPTHKRPHHRLSRSEQLLALTPPFHTLYILGITTICSVFKALVLSIQCNLVQEFSVLKITGLSGGRSYKQRFKPACGN